MNKKGFLLAEETLKIILAVIAIAFLIYFLFALYFSNVHAEKLKQAQAVLTNSSESIKMKIERVRSTQIAETKNIPNPNGWYLFGFVSDPKPNSCVGKNCLCICDKVMVNDFLFWDDRQIKECDEKGVCLIVEDLKKALEKKIEKSTTDILISYSGGIEIR